MGDCLCLPLSSAIIMIIILSRGLTQLAKANYEQGTCQSKPVLNTEGVVSKQPPPYPTSFDPQAWSTHPLLGQSLGYPAVPTKTAIPPLFLDTGLAWSRAVPSARRNPNGHDLTKSDRYISPKISLEILKAKESQLLTSACVCMCSHWWLWWWWWGHKNNSI